MTERKLSELRPCDSCGGPIAPVFNVIQFRLGLINPDETNRTLGLAQMFGLHTVGGKALAIAEAMGDTTTPVKIEADAHEEIFLCQMCTCKPIVIGEILERKAEREGDDGAGEARVGHARST